MAASPKTEEENVAPVTRESTRSDGTQPVNHSNPKTAKTTPGASTTTTSVACKRSIPIAPLPSPPGCSRRCKPLIPHGFRPRTQPMGNQRLTPPGAPGRGGQGGNRYGPFASHARRCGAGARGGLRGLRVAVVDGLGSIRTSALPGHGSDIFLLRFRARRHCREATVDKNSLCRGGLRQLVRGAQLSLPARADGRPPFPSLPGHDRGALRTHRTILCDIPAPGARFSSVLPAAASVRVRLARRVRGRIV